MKPNLDFSIGEIKSHADEILQLKRAEDESELPMFHELIIDDEDDTVRDKSGQFLID